jgi:hypothetical protein
MKCLTKITEGRFKSLPCFSSATAKGDNPHSALYCFCNATVYVLKLLQLIWDGTHAMVSVAFRCAAAMTQSAQAAAAAGTARVNKERPAYHDES